MPEITLLAERRVERGTRPSGRLRRAGKVPAVVYGLATETIAVAVPARELDHILHGESGANTLITLRLDGDQALTLARQIQRHPTKGSLLHVDFVRVRRDVAVSAEVPVHLIGEAVGARDGGLVEQLLFTLEVEAKPEDIPPVVDVDVSELAIGDQLRLGDISLPRGVVAQHDAEELVVQVVMPRVVEEPEVEEEAAEGEEVPEGEAPPEGEAAAPAEGAEGRETSGESGEG